MRRRRINYTRSKRNSAEFYLYLSVAAAIFSLFVVFPRIYNVKLLRRISSLTNRINKLEAENGQLREERESCLSFNNLATSAQNLGLVYPSPENTVILKDGD